MNLMDAIKNLTPGQRKGSTGAAVAVTALLVGLLGILPQVQSIGELKTQQTALNGELAIARDKMKRLDELIKENKRLQALLEQQKRQLPDSFEVDALLKLVSDAASRAGLNIMLWRPENVKRECLYQELPITLEVAGSYHQLGVFFEYMGQMDRLMNFSKIDIEAEKNRPSNQLSTSLVASAFATLPPDPQAAQAAPAAKPTKAAAASGEGPTPEQQEEEERKKKCLGGTPGPAKAPTPPGAALTEKGH